MDFSIRFPGLIASLVLVGCSAFAQTPGPAADDVAANAAWCRDALKVPAVTSATASVPDPRAGGALDLPPQARSLVMSLSLSGGGYRAMLFHVGTLRRLNDAGLLPSLSVVSSVSGGSVASAWLAYRWADLAFDDQNRATNFDQVIETPLRELAHTTLDIPSALVGLLPFTSAASRQVAHYDEHLFHGALLKDVRPGMPDGGGPAQSRPRPLFIFNATNLQTGEAWQFRATAMGGPLTLWTEPDDTRLAEAVAASSGFPPVLSPLVLHPVQANEPARWHDCSDARDNPYGVSYRHEPGRMLPVGGAEEYRRNIYLIDGGVRDNLGISPIEEINRLRRLDHFAFGTVTLISDGGATTAFESSPATNWLSQSMRLLNLMSDQPDEVRVGNLIRTGSARLRGYGWDGSDSAPNCALPLPPPELDRARSAAASSTGDDAYAYWSIRRRPKLHRGFECPDKPDTWMAAEVNAMATIPTAFRAMNDVEEARLINWGYLAAHHGLPYVDFAWPDVSLRRRWLAPCALPYGPDVTDPEGKAPSAREARCLQLKAAG